MEDGGTYPPSDTWWSARNYGGLQLVKKGDGSDLFEQGELIIKWTNQFDVYRNYGRRDGS